MPNNRRSRSPGVSEDSKPVQRVAAYVFGVVFVVVLLLLALFVPHPTPFQYLIFRVVLALAAAGVAAMIPGFIEMNIHTWLRAGGALAVFAIVFFYNPASLVTQDPKLDPDFIEVGTDEPRTLSQLVQAAARSRNVTIVFDESCNAGIQNAMIEKGSHEGNNMVDFINKLAQRAAGKVPVYHAEKKGDQRYEIKCP